MTGIGKVRCVVVVRELTFTYIFTFWVSRVLMIFNGVFVSDIRFFVYLFILR